MSCQNLWQQYLSKIPHLMSQYPYLGLISMFCCHSNTFLHTYVHMYVHTAYVVHHVCALKCTENFVELNRDIVVVVIASLLYIMKTTKL